MDNTNNPNSSNENYGCNKQKKPCNNNLTQNKCNCQIIIENCTNNCKPKDKICNCCNISKLKDLLLKFKEKQTMVNIFSKNSPIEYKKYDSIKGEFVNTLGYIIDVKNDTVSISLESPTGYVKYIIPLCSINLVLANFTNDDANQRNKLSSDVKNIISKNISEKTKCCCVSGITSNIKNLLNSASDFDINIKGSSNITQNTVSTPCCDGYSLRFRFPDIIVNNDFFLGFYPNYDSNTDIYFIVPTCMIDTVIPCKCYTCDSIGDCPSTQYWDDDLCQCVFKCDPSQLDCNPPWINDLENCRCKCDPTQVPCYGGQVPNPITCECEDSH